MPKPDVLNAENSNLTILGKGKYLPGVAVPSEALDRKLGVSAGTCEKKSGVAQRHFAGDETVSEMAAQAGLTAVSEAGISFNELSALIYAGATPEQPIPCNAVLIQKAMGESKSGVPCFDLDSTCLSFLVAFDLVCSALESGRYHKVLLVTSEIASGHLDYSHIESASLFGDGAVAYVLGKEPVPSTSGIPFRILARRTETYSAYSDSCQIPGGGSKLSPHLYHRSRHKDYCFQMDGPKIFKKSLMLLPGFLDRVLSDLKLCLSDIALVVPHQASRSAMQLIQRKLAVPDSRWVQIIETHGNQISASIPTALYEAMNAGRVKSGDLVLLLGTGAGLSLGAVLIRF